MAKGKNERRICLNLEYGIDTPCFRIKNCRWKKKGLLTKIGCPHLDYFGGKNG